MYLSHGARIVLQQGEPLVAEQHHDSKVTIAGRGVVHHSISAHVGYPHMSRPGSGVGI